MTTFCPDLELVYTHAHPDPNSGNGDNELLKPDVSVYDRKGQARSRPTDFSLLDIHIEFKSDDGDDPFSDTETPFERSTNQGKDTKGQITAYAVAQLATNSYILCACISRLLQDYTLGSIGRYCHGGNTTWNWYDPCRVSLAI